MIISRLIMDWIYKLFCCESACANNLCRLSFCVSYPFSTPGSLEGLHLLLLSSGPLECGDQKGIDDPFSELIDMKRHLFGFRSGDDDDDSKYGDGCGRVA